MSDDQWPTPILAPDDHLVGGGQPWKLNACIGEQLWEQDGLRWYCDGFRRAAQMLAREIIEKGNTVDLPIDCVVYPLFYLYRHHLELRLKNIIVACHLFQEKRPKAPFGHQLDTLWSEASSQIEQVFPEADWSQNQHVSRLIKQLSEVDPNGESGRYPDNRKTGKSFAAHKLLNLHQFSTIIEKLCDYLSEVCDAIEITGDQMREMRDALR